MTKNIKMIGRCIRANIAYAITQLLITAILLIWWDSALWLLTSIAHFFGILLASVITIFTRKKRIYICFVVAFVLLGLVFRNMSFEYISGFCFILATYLFLWLFLLRANLKEVHW